MQEAAVAKKYAARLKKKAQDPERRGSGWWRMEDLKAAFKRYADNPNDPEADFFMGKALQMAGQADDADDRFELFSKKCFERFGSHAAAVEHYQATAARVAEQEKKNRAAGSGTGRANAKSVSLEDYRMMESALLRVEAMRLKRKKRRCVVS